MRTLKNRLELFFLICQKYKGVFYFHKKKTWTLSVPFSHFHQSPLKWIKTYRHSIFNKSLAISAQTRSLTQVDWKKSANQTHTIHWILTDIVDPKTAKLWRTMFLFFYCVRLVGTEFLEENSYYSNKTAPQTFPTAHKQHRIRTYIPPVKWVLRYIIIRLFEYESLLY